MSTYFRCMQYSYVIIDSSPIGIDANRDERNAVLVTAKEYLLSDPSGRNTDIPIIVVKQGFEPPHFRAYFGAWDVDLWPSNPSIQIQDMKQLKISDISDEISGYAQNKTYPYQMCVEHNLPFFTISLKIVVDK